MPRDDRKQKFVYQARSKEQVQARANQQAGMYDSFLNSKFSTFNPANGDNSIRIMPPTFENAESYGIDVWVHYNVGADGGTYLCKDKMKGESCKICEEIAQAVRDGDEKYANDIKMTRRVLVYVIDRKKESEGPKLWSMAWTMDRDINQLSQDKRTGEIYFIDHPEDGFDVDFAKAGKGLQTKYTGIAIARRSTPLSDDEKTQQKWLEFITENPLPDVLNYYDDGHIANKLQGKATDKKEEPKTRSEAKRPSKDDDEPPAKPQKRQPITDPDAELDSDDLPPQKVEPAPAKGSDDDDQPVVRRSLKDDDDEPAARPSKRPPPIADDDD